MIKLSSLAVRLSRLYKSSTGAMSTFEMQEILNRCSSETRAKLMKSSDEELYSLFAGHYPVEEFYTKLCPQPKISHDGISEELAKLLLHMDLDTVLVNEVDLLKALDVIMTPVIRQGINNLTTEMMEIATQGQHEGNYIMRGTLHGFEVSITLPPELDTFMEMVNHLLELRV